MMLERVIRKTGRALVIAAFVLNGLLLMGSQCLDDMYSDVLWSMSRDDSAPLWWQDGSRIAVAMPPEGIYVVDALGSEISIFPPGAPVGACRGEWPFSPALSPDGSRLAYVVGKRDGRSEIVTSALDGSDVRRLTKDRGVHVHPTWSPDGTQIAFVSGSRDRNKDIYVMDADGSNVRMIAAMNYGGAHRPSWSPDGSRVAFAGRNESSDGVVYTVRPDGSDLVEIGETLGNPAWSPDGSRLAYTAKNLEATRGLHMWLYVVDPDGNVQRQWAVEGSHARWHTALSWSPDGSKIVRGFGPGFHIVAADGTGTPVEVLGEDAVDKQTTGGAAWSPDGSTIAFYHNRVLFTTAHDGSDRRVLARAVGEENFC